VKVEEGEREGERGGREKEGGGGEEWDKTDLCEGSAALLIFLGYASAMLGITGFETSANFVEQQKPGVSLTSSPSIFPTLLLHASTLPILSTFFVTLKVFPKTLRNMWLAVAFFNPVISFLSFCILDAKYHSSYFIYLNN
jgi:hypothetical protein